MTATKTVEDVFGTNPGLLRLTMLNSHEQASQIQHHKETKYLISEQKDLQRNYDEQSCNHICVKNIDDLKETDICNLKLGINYGTKLTAETIVKPRGIMNVSTVLEDEYCAVINCAIYNFTQIMQCSIKNLHKILPNRTKIIIKEPYVKLFTANSCSIRIDNPHTNLIIIDNVLKNTRKISDENLYKLEALQLKNTGNNYYKNKKYNIAVRYYSMAIKKCKQSDKNDNELLMKLLNNRALCFLQLKQYQRASKDGLKALTFDETWMKARYTLCSALLGRKRYKEAMDVLCVVSKEELNRNKILKQMKQKLSNKMLQSSQRFHNVKASQLRGLIKYDTDYISDSIKIAWINDKKGRGVIATKHIKAGTFLLREKYFAMGKPNKKWKKYHTANLEVCDVFDLGNKGVRQVAYDLSNVNLIINMMNKYKTGSDIEKYKILLLYDGSNRRENKYIPSMNVFKYNELPQNINAKDIPMLSMRRIAQICEKNQFTCAPTAEIAKIESDASDMFGNIPDSLNVPSAAVIYLVCSFFNQSEVPNCVADGDHERKVIVALSDIKKGQELTISYYKDFTNMYPFDYNQP